MDSPSWSGLTLTVCSKTLHPTPTWPETLTNHSPRPRYFAVHFLPDKSSITLTVLRQELPPSPRGIRDNQVWTTAMASRSDHRATSGVAVGTGGAPDIQAVRGKSPMRIFANSRMVRAPDQWSLTKLVNRFPNSTAWLMSKFTTNTSRQSTEK